MAEPVTREQVARAIYESGPELKWESLGTLARHGYLGDANRVLTLLATHLIADGEERSQLARALQKYRASHEGAVQENAALRARVGELVTWMMNAEDAAREEEQKANALRAQLAEAERVIAWAAGQEPPGDWACVECHPNSDMLVAGFQCAVHLSRRLTPAKESRNA